MWNMNLYLSCSLGIAVDRFYFHSIFDIFTFPMSVILADI